MNKSKKVNYKFSSFPIPKNSKKGQVAIFVIIGILIVAGVALTIVFRDSIFPSGSSYQFDGVYDYFDSCIEQNVVEGLKIAGMQGGYLDVPDFEPGSEYAPFSSQLDFLGAPVPYWYYVSGNGVVKEQVPSLSEIESQLELFLEEELSYCNFDEFRKEGYLIEEDGADVSIDIRNNEVRVSVGERLVVERGDVQETKSNHEVEVFSKFGEFYDLAREIYDKEKKEMFLENYAVDVMYNYAPVTGVEIGCAPKVWKGQEVVDELLDGITNNLASLKVKGDYYTLQDKSENYFVIDVESDERVNFLYDREWPTRVEIWPADGNLLIAEPVGLEQGMGILGFCYIPYHFVYDIYHPVLIQVYDGNELFQFPVSVVIDKSVARESIEGAVAQEEGGMEDFCNYKNTNFEIYTYDSNLNPVEADIDFVCLNERCNIGNTEVTGADAVLRDKLPQCVNGRIIARAGGYVDAEYVVSTNEGGVANILLDELHELDLELRVGGSGVNSGLAIINFAGEGNSISVVYPEQKKVSLSEGLYDITVQVFGDSSLTLPASSSQQCVETPASGLFGLFGKTTEQCFDVEIPAQKIEQALVAGGKLNKYILDSELAGSNKIVVSVNSLPSVNSLEQLQVNYELASSSVLEVNII